VKSSYESSKRLVRYVISLFVRFLSTTFYMTVMTSAYCDSSRASIQLSFTFKLEHSMTRVKISNQPRRHYRCGHKINFSRRQDHQAHAAYCTIRNLTGKTRI